MYKKINNTGNILIMLALVLMLALSACGPSTADATPTLSVDAIFTIAYQTLTAQQATQLALTPPTEIPSPTPPPLPTQSGNLLFGSPTTGSGVQSCNNAAFVKDITIPDGTTENPGSTFIKTWSLQNSGTCAWSTSYKFTFISGDSMNGTSVPAPNSVPAGQQVQISVSLTAPTAPGNYKGYWRMQDDQGRYFGDSPWVAITVSGSTTVTPTGPTNTMAPATITLTPSLTATSTP